MQVGIVYLEREIQSNIYCDQADSLQKVIACKYNHVYNYKSIYIEFLVIVDQERKSCHFCFKAICGPKAGS